MQPFLEQEAVMSTSRLTLARTRESLQELSDAERKSLDRIQCTRARIQRTDELLAAVAASWARGLIGLPDSSSHPGHAE
jgi:hypothetical protein